MLDSVRDESRAPSVFFKIMEHTPEPEDIIRHYIMRSGSLSSVPRDHDRLIDVGFVSSVRLLDLVGFLEEAFRIRLRARDLIPEKLSTVAQIAQLVRSRLKT